MQKIYKGRNAVVNLNAEILSAGYKSVFIITGNHFKSHLPELLNYEIRTTSYCKSGTNVTEEEADIAFSEFKKSEAEVVLAIGGGSVIDLAKAVIYSCLSNKLTVPYFLAVPTTAGPGTEATYFAVVYIKGKKQSWVHPSLLPQVVILDPELTYSVNAEQTAISGMDILAQAVESYWSKLATLQSKQNSAECISLWSKYFILSVKNPGPESRENMQWAAHLAGKAINITRTTGPHALSYFLTANYEVPHGQAVALFLPVFFLYNNAAGDICKLIGCSTAIEAKEQIQIIMKQVGLKISFTELGINKEEIIDELLNEVNAERFANNPVDFDREKIRKLIIDYL
jgi:alcohol dehydrogenase class IV